MAGKKIDPAVAKEMRRMKADIKASHRWINILSKRQKALEKKLLNEIKKTRAWVVKLHK